MEEKQMVGEIRERRKNRGKTKAKKMTIVISKRRVERKNI